MARILVQTDDRRTVLDEGDVELTDIFDQDTATGLLDRLEAAVRDADREPRRRENRHTPLAAVAHASDYRDVGD